MNMGSVDRGASDDQISQLPSWKYKAVDTTLEHVNDTDCSSGPDNEDPVSDTTLIFRIPTQTQTHTHKLAISHVLTSQTKIFYLAYVIEYLI